MKTIVSGILLLTSITGFATDSLTMDVDVNSAQFVVKLPSNPTTGFQLSVTKYDKTILDLKESKYIAPQTKLIGAGGEMTFTFALIKGRPLPEKTLLLFKNARSWEPAGGFVTQVTVHFIASAQQP